MKRDGLAAMGAVFVLTGSLAGCGAMRESRLNPLNWFGQSGPRESIVLVAEAEDTRALVDQVLEMQVEPYSAGAIVRAKGLAPTQGWWDAELVARPVDENGVLVYDFRVFPPLTETPAGAPQTREITVAVSISNVALTSVTEIVVQGASNARSSRR